MKGHQFSQRPAKHRAWCSCGLFFSGKDWLAKAKAHMQAVGGKDVKAKAV